MKDFSKFGPYTRLDKDVVGSGANAVQYLPDDLRAVAQRASTFFPSKEEVRPSGSIDWREGVRLTKGATEAKDLKYQDLYKSLKRSHTARSQGEQTPEFLDKVVITPADVAKAKAKVDTSALAGFGASPEAAEVAGAVATAVVSKIEEARKEEEQAKAADKNKMVKSLIPVILLVAGLWFARKKKWI
jgi:hypothetical protein